MHYLEKRIPLYQILLKAISETRQAGHKAVSNGYYNKYHVMMLQKYNIKHESWKNEKRISIVI